MTTAEPKGRLAVALAAAAAQLTDAGVRTALEPGDVAVPGGWLQLRSVDTLTLSGSGTGTAWLYLVAPDTGTVAALNTLSGLLDLVLSEDCPLAVNIGEGDVIDTSQAIVLPHTSTPLPAFRLVVDVDIN